ncbi:hypothetical protein FRB93_004620 [Tulasnella sp. JGI-2019a]|nr:hypothetical protein FRB93_004620 [Tulasnella sp. JGI-2019a]
MNRYLPLLLLPFPQASPWFLLIFLASITLNVRPCLYCTVLLAALFTTTCFWQPAPTDVILQGHRDLINSTSPTHLLQDVNLQHLADIVEQYRSSNSLALASETVPDGGTPTSTAPPRPLTTLLPRCWCDVPFSFFTSNTAGRSPRSGAATTTPSQRAASQRTNRGIFEPFDQKAWEATSLVKQAREETKKQQGEEPEDDFTNQTAPELITKAIPEAHGADDGAVNPLRQIWRATLSPLRIRFGRLISNKSIAAAPKDDPNGPKTMQGTHVQADNTFVKPSTPAEEGITSQSPGPSAPPPAFDYSLVSLAWSFVPFKGLWRTTWPRVITFIQGKYDLRPYGLGVTVDFGWAGQKS